MAGTEDPPSYTSVVATDSEVNSANRPKRSYPYFPFGGPPPNYTSAFKLTTIGTLGSIDGSTSTIQGDEPQNITQVFTDCRISHLVYSCARVWVSRV